MIGEITCVLAEPFDLLDLSDFLKVLHTTSTQALFMQLFSTIALFFRPLSSFIHSFFCIVFVCLGSGTC